MVMRLRADRAELLRHGRGTVVQHSPAEAPRVWAERALYQELQAALAEVGLVASEPVTSERLYRAGRVRELEMRVGVRAVKEEGPG